MTRTQYRRPPGIVVHADSLRDDEIVLVGDIPCTTPQRTAYDLGRRLPLTVGLIRVDALLRATGVPVDDVAAVARRYPGGYGIVCRATAALRAAGWSPETAVDGGVTRDLCS